jgi:hypothetical protein
MRFFLLLITLLFPFVVDSTPSCDAKDAETLKESISLLEAELAEVKRADASLIDGERVRKAKLKVDAELVEALDDDVVLAASTLPTDTLDEYVGVSGALRGGRRDGSGFHSHHHFVQYYGSLCQGTF